MNHLLDLFRLMFGFLLGSFAQCLNRYLNILGENGNGYMVEGAVLSDLDFSPLGPILEALDTFFE